MLVGVNATMLVADRGGGEERYLRRVLATMRAVQPDTQFVVFTNPANNKSFDGWDRECLDVPRRGLFGGAEPPSLDAPIKRRAVEVLFSPLAAAPPACSVPVVIFGLDLRAWDAEFLKKNRLKPARAKTANRACANATAIVAPSQFVQRKYLSLFDIPLNKVIVAPLGIDPLFEAPQSVMVEKPYLLFVGDTREFKNLPLFLKTYDQFQREYPKHSLVVVGQPAEAEPKAWGPRVIRLEHCPASHLAGFYQHCDIYVQPSLYEGSGVTVLEAMRSSAPVAASRTGGIPEVAGDTPYYFNPENEMSMLSTLRRILEEPPAQRAGRLKFGRQSAAEYTWEKCAWKTLSAFKRT